MKKQKQAQLFQMMRDLVDESVELGMARQRHMDAAADEQEAAQGVAEIGHAIGQLVGAPTDNNKRRDVN